MESISLLHFIPAYKMLDGSPAAWAQKAVYFVSNLAGIALALYKCQSMGLLPTHSSDWLSFLEPAQVSTWINRHYVFLCYVSFSLL